ncbi:GRIP and coiled-coil domain-containing protein 2-like [Macrobrachium nipponense]|uniref:GRIP and coiled-coil domain-containing protein 2-like n=1 Tax=Macrobrachium nipponense TaxID=159736 RepID=UPI0030C86D85
MKQSYKKEIENVRAHQKDKIDVLEYENDRLKKVILAQNEAMNQRNSEIESLIHLVKGIPLLPTNGADAGDQKANAIREEGDSPKKCDAGLERLRDLILEMSYEMEGLRMDLRKVNNDFNETLDFAITSAYQIDEKVEEMSEMIGELSRRENSIEEMAKEIQRKDERHQDMETRLATANEKIVLLQRELLNEQNKTELLEIGVTEKDNRIESLICEVHRLVEGEAQTSGEVKGLRGEMASANAKIDRLQEDNCLKEKRLSEAERRLEHLANKFEERSAAAAAEEKVKVEGQEERHSQLCEEIENLKRQMYEELNHPKRCMKEASEEKLGISAMLHQSLLRTEFVIELGRLKEQLSKGKDKRIQFTEKLYLRKKSKTPGHVETLVNEDLRHLTSSEEIDGLSRTIEGLHGKDSEEVLGSKDWQMQSLCEAIDHLVKLLSQEEENKDRAAAVEMVADLREQKRVLGFTKRDMTVKAHIDTHIHVLNRARGKDIQIQMDKILDCVCQPKPGTEDINILENNVLPSTQEENKDRAAAVEMVANLRKQKRLLGFTKEDMTIKAHIDTHIHVLSRAQGKDIHTQMDKILNCVCQSTLGTEDINILENNVLPATQDEEVLLDPKYTTEELISSQEEVTPAKEETSSISKIIISEGFVLVSTTQAGPVVPEESCPTPQAAPTVSEDLCLTPQAAPIVLEELLVRKERDAFHVEGAAFSGDEQALHNDREALNMERLAHIKEKEAFAAEREAFYRHKEEFDEDKDAFLREVANFYREKEELEQLTTKIENVAKLHKDKQETLDRIEQELVQKTICFEEMKADFLQEKVEFQNEKEVILEREQETIQCIEKLENIMREVQGGKHLNWSMTKKREVQMQKKIDELEKTIQEKHKLLMKSEIMKCDLLQVLFNTGLVNENTVQQLLNDTKDLLPIQ